MKKVFLCLNSWSYLKQALYKWLSLLGMQFPPCTFSTSCTRKSNSQWELTKHWATNRLLLTRFPMPEVSPYVAKLSYNEDINFLKSKLSISQYGAKIPNFKNLYFQRTYRSCEVGSSSSSSFAVLIFSLKSCQIAGSSSQSSALQLIKLL